MKTFITDQHCAHCTHPLYQTQAQLLAKYQPLSLSPSQTSLTSVPKQSMAVYHVTTGQFANYLFDKYSRCDKVLLNVDAIIQKTCLLMKQYINDNRERFVEEGDDFYVAGKFCNDIHILFHGGIQPRLDMDDNLKHDLRKFIIIRMNPNYRIGNFAYAMFSKHSYANHSFVNIDEIANYFTDVLTDVLTDKKNEYNLSLQDWVITDCTDKDCTYFMNYDCEECTRKYGDRMMKLQGNDGYLVILLHTILNAGIDIWNITGVTVIDFNDCENFVNDLHDFITNYLREKRGLKHTGQAY